MSDSAHSVYSPSAASRWLACPPSIALGLGKPRQSNEYAARGTVAHSLAADILQKGDRWPDIAEVEQEGFLITVDAEMRDAVDAYVAYCTQVVGTSGCGVAETRVRAAFNPEVFGTADFIVSSPDRLDMIDLKMGRGVRVEAAGNKQLLTYAVLWLEGAPAGRPLPAVFGLHIFQPLIGNITCAEVSLETVMAFRETLMNGVFDAYMWIGRGPSAPPPPLEALHAGEHCTFCSVRGTCKAFESVALQRAQMVFDNVQVVPDTNLGEILRHADLIDVWVGAVRQEAMDRAMAGTQIDGFKLVNKRSTRAWNDLVKVAEVATDCLVRLYDDAPMKSPAAIEKDIGKAKFAEIFAPLVDKKSSGLTLVPASDKRSAVDPKTAANDAAAVVFS